MGEKRRAGMAEGGEMTKLEKEFNAWFGANAGSKLALLHSESLNEIEVCFAMCKLGYEAATKRAAKILDSSSMPTAGRRAVLAAEIRGEEPAE